MVNSRLKLIDTAELKAKSFRLPEPLRALRDLTKEFLTQRLSTVFEHVDDAFFDLADRAESNAEQAAYFDAMRMIRLERKVVEQKFSMAINQAFHQLGNVNYKGVVTPVSEASDSFDLEVLENEALEETIAINSMISKVSSHQEYELKKIISRINFLVPAEVTASSNPMGPEVICNALDDAVETVDIDIRSKLMFFKLIDRYLIEGLGELLKTGNDLLREMGVLPDLDKKQMVRKPQSRAAAKPSGSGSLGDELHVPGSAGHSGGVQSNGAHAYGTNANGSRAETEDEQFLLQLQALFQQSEMASRANGAEPVALDDLVNIVSNLQSESALQDRGEQSLLGLIQGKLQSQGNRSLGARHQSVVHLLDQLFSNIRQEPGISDNLGQELRKLEMPILRIALEDSSFFSKEKHPARQLLNEITEASIGYSDDADFASDPVGKAIENVASIMNKSESLDRETLSKLLVNFVTLVEKERRGSVAREQRILEEVAAKEKVNQARQLVDATLEERMQGKRLPQVLVTFAETAWCKVMFMASLRHDKSPELWESSVEILDTLLDAAISGEAPGEALPSLMASVRSRLEDISFDPYELGCLIGGLEQYFDSGLTSGEAANETDTENTGEHQDQIVDLNKLPENDSAPHQASVNSAQQPEPLTSELLKEVTVEKLEADIPGRPQDNELEQDEVEEEFVKIAAALGRGSWVDFMDQEPPNRRCKVAGIISPPGKYIFVNRQGAKVVEMNQNVVAGGIKDKSLVVVESVRMFDRALEQVIRGIRSHRQVH
jgi:hypothetical protein